MNVTLKKFVLLELLEKASAVVPSRDVEPVLKNFLVATSESLLYVAATDMSLSMVVSTDLVNIDSEPMQCVLPAKRMLDVVRQSDDGDVVIAVDDRVATIRSGRTEWVLPLNDADEYPDILAPELAQNDKVEVSRKGLLAGLQAVRGAAAQDDALRANMMLVDVSEGRMRAADGVRFQQIEVGGDYPDMQIPIHAVNDLVRLLKTSEQDNVQVLSTEDSLYFFIGEDFFMAQQMTTSFPDVDALLLKPALTNTWKLSVDREQLIRAVKRVRITADETTSAVTLHLSGDSLIVSSKDRHGSHTREELDVGWTHPDLDVTLNHVHLLDLLEMVTAKSCEFFLAPNEGSRPCPVRFRDDTAKVTGIITQLRTDFMKG